MLLVEGLPCRLIYSAAWFKSPKTLSNVFAKNGEIPPLRQIQNRIALEAKRMLAYSNKAYLHNITQISIDFPVAPELEVAVV